MLGRSRMRTMCTVRIVRTVALRAQARCRGDSFSEKHA